MPLHLFWCFFSPNIELLPEDHSSPAAKPPQPQIAAPAAASPLGPELRPGLPGGPQTAPRGLRVPTPGRGTATPCTSRETPNGKRILRHSGEGRSLSPLHRFGSGGLNTPRICPSHCPNLGPAGWVFPRRCRYFRFPSCPFPASPSPEFP